MTPIQKAKEIAAVIYTNIIEYGRQAMPPDWKEYSETTEGKALIGSVISGEDWISVGERLPEINEPLMAYNDDGVREVLIKNYVATVLAFDPAIGIFKAKIDRSHHWTEVSSVSSNGGVTPTHWQPLPEPPKP